MTTPAVRAIAGWEWSRRWRSLLVLGLVGGLLAGVVVGGAVLARRTISAPGRLLAAVQPGDVHLRIFGGDLAATIAALPGVGEVWTTGVGVGRIDGGDGLQYAGVAAPLDAMGQFEPVVIDGRLARPDDPTEVMVTEGIAAQAGLGPGDRLDLSMLSAEEVFQFDSGFGEPDGPRLALTVTGVMRLPPGLLDGTPVIATPAFAAEQRELFAGYDAYVQLDDISADGFIGEVQQLATSAPPSAGDDFAVVTADRTAEATERLRHSSRVLFAALVATVLLAALAVAVALGQAWARQHGAEAQVQEVEAALGLPSTGRVLARLLPALPACAAAGIVAAAVGALACTLDPVGSLWRVEPHPGWRFDAIAVLGGGALVALATGCLAAFTAWRAGRGPDRATADLGRSWLRYVPSRGGWPLAGAAFALSTAGNRRHVPVRASLVACVIGVAGAVGAVVFAATLDRLVESPARYGWNADFAIADVDDEVVAELLGDERIESVADAVTAETSIDGRVAEGYAFEHRRGSAGWSVLHGRTPAMVDEVMLGPKLAGRLGVRPGDEVQSGTGTTYRVVGIGLGPMSSMEALGSSALFTPAGLDAAATTGMFREAFVAVDPDVDPAVVIADYLEHELTIRSLPSEVRDVDELGSLPAVLGGFLALLAALALAHALVVTARGRARDLAVLEALGAAPRQAGLALVSMSLSTTIVGVVLGAPLGYLIARLLWGEVARSIGVASDLVVPGRVLLVLVAAFALAVVLAAVPAARAARQQVAQVLRSG